MNDYLKILQDQNRIAQGLLDNYRLDIAGRASERKTFAAFDNIEVLNNTDARNVISINGKVGQSDSTFSRADFVLPFTPRKITILASFYGNGSIALSYLPVYAAFSENGVAWSKEVYLPKTFFGMVIENTSASPITGDGGVVFNFSENIKTPFIRIWIPSNQGGITIDPFLNFQSIGGRDPSFPFGGSPSGVPANRNFLNIIGFE